MKLIRQEGIQATYYDAKKNTSSRRPHAITCLLGIFCPALLQAESLYVTKSLVNTNLFYTNFSNTHFQKVPISHLTRTPSPRVTRILVPGKNRVMRKPC